MLGFTSRCTTPRPWATESAAGDGPGQTDGLRDGQRAGEELLGQVGAVEPFHREVGLARLGVPVIHVPDDVRVGSPRRALAPRAETARRSRAPGPSARPIRRSARRAPGRPGPSHLRLRSAPRGIAARRCRPTASSRDIASSANSERVSNGRPRLEMRSGQSPRSPRVVPMPAEERTPLPQPPQERKTQAPAPPKPNAEVEHLAKLYREMLLIRRVEEESARGYAEGKIGGFLHLYIGQEAVGVGAIAALRPDDYVITTYRDHGIALAKGMSAARAPGRALRQGDRLLARASAARCTCSTRSTTCSAATASSAATSRSRPASRSRASTAATAGSRSASSARAP